MTATLHPTLNRLDGAKRRDAVNALAPLVASAIDLQQQTRQAHWNVRGEAFIGLHELFGKVYDAAAGYADTLAERIAQVGGEVAGDIRDAAGASVLKRYPLGVAPCEAHVEALSRSIAAFAELTGFAARSPLDVATQNILIDMTQDAEKWLWLVESHKEPA